MATVSKYVSPDPYTEVYYLTSITDADTVKSRKFKVIHAASLTLNSDSDYHHNVTISTTTATLNIASAAGSTNATLVLYGHAKRGS